MKKTVVKELIAAVLAVSTITASAALFTGCGKNEAPAVSGAQSSGAATESSQQATETSGPIDLKGFLSEIVDKKQYTVKVEDYVATDPKIGFPGKALFKLVANSPLALLISTAELLALSAVFLPAQMLNRFVLFHAPQSFS